MPWKEINLKKLANSLGINQAEVREKQRLMDLIRSIRKKRGLSQVDLAESVGVSQGRIAQIESGVGTHKVSFDVLLNILTTLGYEFRIVMRQ